jgi:hypothetical protein
MRPKDISTYASKVRRLSMMAGTIELKQSRQ